MLQILEIKENLSCPYLLQQRTTQITGFLTYCVAMRCAVYNKMPDGWHVAVELIYGSIPHARALGLVFIFDNIFCFSISNTRFRYKKGGPGASHVQLSLSRRRVNISFKGFLLVAHSPKFKMKYLNVKYRSWSRHDHSQSLQNNASSHYPTISLRQ